MRTKSIDKEALKISVIIPTMNRLDSLKKTVDIILECHDLPDELIIVDQTVDDKLALNIESYISSTELASSYVRLDKASLTKARNVGMTYAKHDIIVQMDDDVDVRPDTFAQIRTIMADHKVALVGGYDENIRMGNNILAYVFGRKVLWKSKIGYVTNTVYGRFPHDDFTQVDTEWAMGFFFVIRKSLHTKWNMSWDEKLIGYAYPEDLDYTYRYYKHANKEKLKCIMTKAVTVKHNVSYEWRTESKKLMFMKVMNREYVRHKLFGTRRSYLLMRWCNFGEIIERIVKKRPFKDYALAEYHCLKEIKQIRRGKFNYE